MSTALKTLLQRYAEEMNRGNDAFLDEYFGPGYVIHRLDGDLDEAGFRANHRQMLQAFPDTRMRILQQVAEGDLVVSRWEVKATHTGPLMGIPPTGKAITSSGIIITRVEDGRAVEEWEQFDMFGLMTQLGVIPPGPPETS